jgi:predicted lipoprotein
VITTPEQMVGLKLAKAATANLWVEGASKAERAAATTNFHIQYIVKNCLPGQSLGREAEADRLRTCLFYPAKKMDCHAH